MGGNALKRQNFLTGAIILAASNIISKILGAVFKIPLTYIIGEEGMAIYNTAFNIYIMFLAFVVSGVPFAVSKLVSEYLSLKKNEMVRYTVKSANIILCIIGLAGSTVLYFGADFFAIALKEEKAVFAIKMIAPSVAFVAAGAGIRSYFQGASNMIPTAVSQAVEAFVKLAAGYILAKGLIKYGISAASGGAVLGVTIGEAVATALFIMMYVFSKKEYAAAAKSERKEVLKAIADIAVPLLFVSAISSMLSVVETSVIRRGLILSGLDVDSARKAYGAYTGYAMTVFHLPAGMLATMGVSLLPVIAGGFAANEERKVKIASFAAFKLTVIFSTPCAVVMFFLSSEILNILFGNNSSAQMLMMSAPCLAVMCTANILTSIIQSSGRIVTSFVYLTAGMVLKIIISVFTIKVWGIYGVIAAANISSVLVMAASMIITKKIIGLKFKILDTIIKPVIAALVMCLIIMLIKPAVTGYVKGVIPQTGIICSVSVSAYIMTLFLTGALKYNKGIDIGCENGV